MREFKIRIWDVKDNCWYYTVPGKPEDHNILGTYYFEDVYQDEDDYIWEQYTGLKDKNGKEIYEGDILGGIWESGYIAWCNKCKQFQYHIPTNECMACLGDVHWYELVDDDGKLEVIGNIHENPELLKGGK